MSLFPEIEKIQIVKDLKGFSFKTKIKKLWEDAEIDIHPFQKGDTHQASLHCKNVISNLSKLSKITRLNNLEKYLLCCAAILHDIDKAVIDYNKKIEAEQLHGLCSAEYIIKNRNEFSFSRSEADAIAFITRYHGHKGLDPNSNYQIKKIEDPSSYAKYRKLKFDMLAALFRLADMMDVTYKRISKYIVKLNFPNGVDDLKVLAREAFDQVKVTQSKIILTTHYISEFRQYQAVLIAIDMANEELEKKGAKYYLKNNKLPNIFELDESNLSDGNKFTQLSGDRKKISSFDGEGRLTINDIDEEKLKEIFFKNKSNYEFSEGELKQLKIKCKDIYYNSIEKPIVEIRKNMQKHFQYSIDQMIITRIYDDMGGRIDTQVEYLGIKKPKGVSFPIIYEIDEKAIKAKHIKKYCTFEDYLENNEGSIKYLAINKCRIMWPPFEEFDQIERIKAKFRVINAWAMKKTQLAEMYPNDPEDYEDYRLYIKYPVCNVKIRLIFPSDYNIKPKCFYTFSDKSEELVVVGPDQNSPHTVFTIENLQMDDITSQFFPNYYIKWTVPD